MPVNGDVLFFPMPPEPVNVYLLDLLQTEKRTVLPAAFDLPFA